MAHLHLAQPLSMVIPWLLAQIESALCDHPVAISQPSVARRAIDVEPFPTAVHVFPGDWKRKHIHKLFVLNPLRKCVVRGKTPRYDGVRHGLACGSSIRKEVAGLKRFMDLRLGPHIRVAS